MISLQPEPVFLCQSWHSLQAHVVFQVRQLDGPGDRVGLDFGYVIFVAVFGVMRQTGRGCNDFFRESSLAQLFQRDRRVLNDIVQNRRGHRYLVFLLKHQAQRV